MQDAHHTGETVVMVTGQMKMWMRVVTDGDDDSDGGVENLKMVVVIVTSVSDTEMIALLYVLIDGDDE